MIKRYTREKMGRVWDEENRFSIMLNIEILCCEAHSQLGIVPKKALQKIKKKAKFNAKKIRQIENKTQHDVVAFVRNVSESIGKEARFLHLGLTSSDLLDTATACQLKEASSILIDGIDTLLKSIKKLAKKHKYTPMVGRSHGMHAEPITFGLKMALFYDELERDRQRLLRAKETVSVGKVSGSVGTYANVDPFVQKYVCKKLGLKSAKISNQIIQRDRIAEFLSAAAITAGTLEKLALEIRHLQRTEVAEVQEPFGKGQTGSSSMPHKKNPIICERICGLARVLRANALCSFENMPLWHERDISHSSAERIILPDSTILLDYILDKADYVIKGLRVDAKRMKENIEKTNGLIFSQKILSELVKKGLLRKDAYSIVQKIAMTSADRNESYEEAVKKDKKVRQYLSEKQIDKCFSLDEHLKKVDKIFRDVGI